jgi:spore coat protein U domain-containing protein, fimbrial subunit CupE1/2/3/6
MNRRLSLIAASIAVIAGIAIVRPARAGTANADLAVTANVVAACSIDATTLDFGDYNPAALTALDVSKDITIHCTQGSTFWVGLDNGLNFGATRQMANAGERLGYELYRDAARTVAFDNLDPGAANHTASNQVGLGYSSQIIPVHGRILALQAVPAGVYTDTVVMTVNF